ncbi:hypothetical protein INT43_000792 [Umbelopsis isabellina]|uniref:Cyclin N-terminal domain-containing protein n=1 Tax=Mortierella isabellina TaxID=91625 RepID=A0A8H7Q4G7_MORIS|nr:hypothetical protein INT43_000792 [Umbelopsis isabellina]
MSTANRNARRETARQAAFSFLSNIALGSEVDNSNAQNGDNDYSDNFGDSNFKSALPSQASDHGSPVVADYPGNAGRSGSAGTTTLPRTRSWSRTSDMKIDTTKQGETFPNAKADHQSPRNRDDLSESPSEFRSKEPTSATVSGNSLSDGDLDDNSMSRSGQLSGSAILSGGDSTATSLLSKQLEQRPDVASSRRNKSDYFEYEDHHHHKLTREDNSKPIASEKIKKKHVEKEVSLYLIINQSHRTVHFNSPKSQHTGLGILSAFRYYSDKIRQSAIKRRGENAPNKGYVSDEDIEKELTPSAYDPYFLDNENLSADRIKAGGSSHGTNTQPRPAEVKRELNELFRSAHPEIPQEITLSKIRAIKEHMLEIGKELDLEISSVAHAYVYFEKLILKNRKLIAGCCLFLATKVNEPKGSKLQPLLDAIDDELDIDAEEIWEHEFAVFADLEFNLYVPRREFMPHFERICSDLELRSIEAYLGDMDFFSVDIK